MNLLKFEQEDCSADILEKLNGKCFFAVVLTEDDNFIYYQNKVSLQEIIFGCNLLTHSLLDEYRVQIIEQDHDE